MALMTHARTQPGTADYSDLTAATQGRFDYWMRQADAAKTGDAYREAMTEAALTAGVAVPVSRDLARCSCFNDAGGCGCGAIFDSHQVGVVVTATNDPNCNLSRLQCPDCGHDHPRPIED